MTDEDRARDRAKLGERLSLCRRRLKLDQDGLAAALKVTRQTISNWERGKGEPFTTDLPRILAAFRERGLPLTAAALIGDGDEPLPEAGPVPEPQKESAAHD